MCTVLLIRHADHPLIGRALAGRDDGIHLSDAGREQAVALAQSLSHAPIACIQSSPRLRCIETAEALAEAFDLPVLIESALDEIDFGKWNGANFESLHRDPAWQIWNTERACARTPGGESMAEAQARIVDHLQSMQQRYAGRTIAMITHAEIIRAAWLHYAGRPLEEWQNVQVAPASVTRLDLVGMPAREIVLEAAAS